MLRPIHALLFLSFALLACQPGSAPQSDADKAAESIQAERIRNHVEVLSSDAFGGREPASPGDKMTRDYLVGQMEALGLEPAFGESYLQGFPILGIASDMPEIWTIRNGAGEELDLAWHEEYMGTSGLQEAERPVAFENAEFAFCGYGIVAPEQGWNDYAGMDVTGKVVIVLNDDPDWDPELFAGEERLYYGRWGYKYEEAARQGAVGCIILHTDKSAGYPWAVVQNGWSGIQYELPAGDEERLELTAWITWAKGEELVALGGQDLAALETMARASTFKPVALDLSASMEIGVVLSGVQTANVGGILRGSDPELAREIIVYTAHHDHIGQREGEGDTIFNGAVDNASGCGQVLEIMRAFSELPERPKRSVMALFVAAEEQGLLGSRFFAANPPVHPGWLAANINIDSGNIFGRTTQVAVMGAGKNQLEDLLRTAAAGQDRELIADPTPRKGSYYRSDQLNFARIGVPALYFRSGQVYRDRPEGWGAETLARWTKEQYHQPSDELDDSWDFSGMIEDARLAFHVGHMVAEAKLLPAWSPGDEFEALRKEALLKRR